MIEHLESRIAPAALVVQTFRPAHSSIVILKIFGDPENNTLTIDEQPDHKLVVRDGFLTYNPIGPVAAVQISLEGDNDAVTLNYAYGFSGTSTVNLGDGTNSVSLPAGAGGQVYVYGGGGADTVSLPGGVSVSGLTIKPGGGTNTLNVSGNVGHDLVVGTSGGGNTTLNVGGHLGYGLHYSGDGTNAINFLAGSSTAFTNYFNFRSGNDMLTVQPGAALGGIHYLSARGTDTITFGGSQKNVSLSVTGDGSSTVTHSAGATSGDLHIHLGQSGDGTGTNTVNLGGTMQGKVSVNGYRAADRINIGQNVQVSGTLRLSLGSGNNTVDSSTATSSVLGNIQGGLFITAGSGDDFVRLSGFSVPYGVRVRLGGGTNGLDIPARFAPGVGEIAALTAPFLTYVGGRGVDTITVESSESVIGSYGVSGTFHLGAGNDSMTISGSKPVFMNNFRLFGDGGTDTFVGKALLASEVPPPLYRSIEILT